MFQDHLNDLTMENLSEHIICLQRVTSATWSYISPLLVFPYRFYLYSRGTHTYKDVTTPPLVYPHPELLLFLYLSFEKGMTICQTDEFVHISFFGWCSFFLFYGI